MQNISTRLAIYQFERYPVRVRYGIPYSMFLVLTDFDETITPRLWRITRLYPGRRGTTIAEYGFVNPKEIAEYLAFHRMVSPRAAEAIRKYRADVIEKVIN